MSTTTTEFQGCNQKDCSEPGVYRFTWPGRDEATICEQHIGHLCAVADAIGLYLQIRPVAEPSKDNP